MRRDTGYRLSLVADRCIQISPSPRPSVAPASFSASSSDGNGPISSSFFIKDNEHQNQASPFAITLKLGPVDSAICSSAPGRMCAASSNFGAVCLEPAKRSVDLDLSDLTAVQPRGAQAAARALSGAAQGPGRAHAPRREQSAMTRLATSCQTCERVAEPSPGPAVLHRWQTGLSSRALKCAERLPPRQSSRVVRVRNRLQLVGCERNDKADLRHPVCCRAPVGQLGTRDRGSDLLDNGPARRGSRHFQPSFKR
jgi:hypothetical protein